MKLLKRCWPVVLVVCILQMAQPRTAAAADEALWQKLSERWYILELAGGRAGWQSETIESSGSQYRTHTEFHFEIARGPTSLTIDMTSTFLETADGKPISLSVMSKTGRQPMETQWRFEADHVVEISKQSGKELTTDRPLPKQQWLTPMAQERLWKEQLASGAEQVQFRMLDGQSGLKLIEVTSKHAGEETLEHDGTAIPVTIWTTRTDILPIDATEKRDQDGRIIHSEAAMPFGKMVTRLSTKAEATAALAGGGPELMLKTFIKPDKPVKRAMKTSASTLRLRARSGQLPELPSAGAQRVERAADGASATVTIDINDSLAATSAEQTDAQYLAPTPLANSDDEMVRKLAAKAVTDAGDSAMTRAEALRKFVHNYVSRKGMDTAFASASETAVTRRGDCSEHGVLLCAMLRAEKIPARVACGLLYVDDFAGANDIFGWHMWTQALVDGKWIDLDATLPGRYHAMHVLTSLSSLADGAMSTEMASVITMMGNLEIDVLDVGYEAGPAAPSTQDTPQAPEEE